MNALHHTKSKARSAITLLCLLILSACGGGSSGDSAPVVTPPTPNPLGSGGINALGRRGAPYLVLVSLDGFRWDYQSRFDTPAMDRRAAAGVRAQALVPVFPTLTFPNHYSIATGLVPANHGIVANSFPSIDRQRWYRLSDPQAVGDGSWYGGEPIWVAAEKSGLVSAAFFFVGTEAEIAGVRPTFWQVFDSSIPGENRVDQVLEWLNLPDETRPHFITLYFEDIDAIGHQFGPDSAQVKVAVNRVDGYLGQLLTGIDQLSIAQEVYVILVSDHGMSSPPAGSQVLIESDVINLDGISSVGSGAYSFLFFDQSDAARAIQIRDSINSVWANGQAWRPADTPASWSVSAASRFPDLIVQADPNFRVVAEPAALSRLPIALHGWSPDFTDMHGIFLASGPLLATGMVIESANVIDVYPLMMEILGIPISTPIDGDLDALTILLQ